MTSIHNRLDLVEKIEEIQAFKTTDGRTHDTLQKACDHQQEIDFHQWCQENICRGGDWASDMVAEEILLNFDIIPKEK